MDEAGTGRKAMRAVTLVLGLVLAGSLSACTGGKPPRPDLTEEIVDAQIVNLENSDFTVRRCAARALGRIGPRAARALPALRRALEDTAPTVRDAARLALTRIDPAGKGG